MTNQVSYVEQINDWLTQSSELLSRLNGLPGVMLVFLSCIGVGLMIKRWRIFDWLPNEAIKAVVPLWGACFMLLLADPLTDALPFRIWLGKNFLVGFIIGISAVTIHAFVIKPAIKRWFKSDPLGDSDPQAFTKKD